MRLGATRRWVVGLGVLAAAWLVLALVPPRPTSGNRPPAAARPTAAPAPSARTGPAGARSGALAAIPRFRDDLLERPRPESPEALRDLFWTAPPPKPVPPPRPAATPTPEPVVVAPPPPPPPPAPVAIAPAPPPPPPPPPTPDPFFEEWRAYRLIGTANGPDGARAFVVKGRDFLVIRPADALGTQYVVKAIDAEAVVLTSPDAAKEVRLLLPPASGSGRDVRAGAGDPRSDARRSGTAPPDGRRPPPAVLPPPPPAPPPMAPPFMGPPPVPPVR